MSSTSNGVTFVHHEVRDVEPPKCSQCGLALRRIEELDSGRCLKCSPLQVKEAPKCRKCGDEEE